VVSCPKCGARYELTEQAAHQAFACTKCGTRFAAPELAAFRAAAAAVAAPHIEPVVAAIPDVYVHATASGLSSRLRGISLSKMVSKNVSRESAFSVGVVLLVVAYLLAVLDDAAVTRAQSGRAAVEYAFRQERSDLLDAVNRTRRESIAAENAVADALAAPAGQRADLTALRDKASSAQEAYQREASRLTREYRLFKVDRDTDVDTNSLSQQIDRATNSYWYTWLQLPGFICLFLGCIAYLTSESRVKRVTGSIILSIALPVLILLYMVPGTLQNLGLTGGQTIRTPGIEPDDPGLQRFPVRPPN
jgi:hypothetical protein